jgi:exopolysaccharide biosynthesis polyprenyl glycosylphosphotransferase
MPRRHDPRQPALDDPRPKAIHAPFQKIHHPRGPRLRRLERPARIHDAHHTRLPIFQNPAKVLTLPRRATTLPDRFGHAFAHPRFMIAQRHEINLQLMKVVDALLLGALFWFAHFLRYNDMIILDRLVEIDPFPAFLWMLAVVVPFAPFFLELQGFYSHPQEKNGWLSLQQIASAGVWLFVLLGASVIFLRLQVPSRSVLILFGLFAPVALMGRERLWLWFYLRSVKAGAIGERIVLAGEPASMEALLTAFTPAQKMEIRVVERVDLSVRPVEDLVQAVHRSSVGRVVLAFSRMELEKVQRAIEACEVEGVEAWLSTEFIATSIARPAFSSLGNRPMLVFRTTPEISWSLFLKNTIDRIGAFLGLILLSPLFLLIALAIKLTSPGPVLFRQQRAGLHGRPFEMLKFRTMHSNAEQRRADLMELNEMKGPVFKITDDPRITPLGRFLRRTSLDEFPQLVNVLRGEMSLVGPRPLPVYEVESFERAVHRRRLSMKPGLTCIWQIRGRNQVTNFDDWVRMDLEYIDNWSLFLDSYIIVRTVPTVLLGIGAR